MTIKELAQVTGLPISTIRYYERLGLLSDPERLPNNYRKYSDQNIKKLQLIQYLSGLGLTLGKVRDLLQQMAEQTMTKDQLMAILKAQQIQIEDQLGRLIDLKTRLNQLENHDQLLDDFLHFDWTGQNQPQKPVDRWIEQVNQGHLDPDISSLLMKNNQ